MTESLPDNPFGLSRDWESRDHDEWKANPGYYIEFGKQAISLGLPSLAYDILSEGIQVDKNNIDMKCAAALALVKSGSLGVASRIIDEILPELDADDQRYVDTLCLSGRIAKDRWARLPDGEEKALAGEHAARAYERAYVISDDYFPGINAATMQTLIGNREKSAGYAEEVQALCKYAQEKEPGNHWLLATLGEANLLKGDVDSALDAYQRAVEIAGNRTGDLVSMRGQLQLISRTIDIDERILQLFDIGKVVVFAGHMIDSPGRAERRFPAEIEDSVAQAIEDKLEAMDARYGFCSAACGADILFIEKMLERGAEVNVILPFSRDDFIQTSVAFGGEQWVERFNNVLGRVTHLSYAINEGYLGDDILFKYTSDLMQGEALLRGEQLGTETWLLAVMEPDTERHVGGTLQTLDDWKARGRKYEAINLAEHRTGLPALIFDAVTNAKTPLGPRDKHQEKVWARREIMTMLFADVVGFSKLREENAPSFFVDFLGEVAKVMNAGSCRPVFWNTWGDGLYLVFDDVVKGAEFALNLRDTVLNTEWEEFGLPVDVSIRIGMHTGPVFPSDDPIIERKNFFGSHVNRAARIEPVTAPGAVYISEQMAAALKAREAEQFSCDYLGALALAKSFGNSSLYRLRRAREIE